MLEVGVVHEGIRRHPDAIANLKSILTFRTKSEGKVGEHAHVTLGPRHCSRHGEGVCDQPIVVGLAKEIAA